MTTPDQDNTQQMTDKEINFQAFRTKTQARIQEIEAENERLRREVEAKKQMSEEEEDNSEPYVDHKKLSKTLAKYGQATQTEIQKAMEQAKYAAKEELKQEMWVENNSDFYDVLKHADKFAQQNPKMAETLLRMPEGFERQKLVYQTIKALKIDQPEKKEPSIQDKIDANRRTPYYQPSGVSAAPYTTQSDFSPTGQKDAYNKIQELKRNLRLG